MKRTTAGSRSLAAVLALGLAFVPMMASAQDPEVVPMEESSGFEFPGDLSGNVGYFSDYRFRGISQTGEEFAIQGGFDLGLPSGFYLGTWASNVEFGSREVAEVDVYAGWATDLDGVGLDLSAIYFVYPGGESGLNYWEFALGLGYSVGDVGLSAGIVYSPDYFSTLGTGFVFSGGVAYDLPLGDDLPFSVSADANVNYTIADEDIITDDDYVDWNVGVSIAMGSNWDGLAVDLRYVDTDLPDEDGQDATFVYGMTYSF